MFGFHSPKMAWWSVPKKAGLNWNRFELCGWRVVLGTLILHAMTHSRIRDRTSLRAAKNGDTHTHAWQHASRDVSKVISDKPDSQLAAPRLVSTFRQHATGPYIYIYIYMVPCPVSRVPTPLPPSWDGGGMMPLWWCIYIYTYIHTYLPTYLHTYTHTHTDIHTYLPTYIHT